MFNKEAAELTTRIVVAAIENGKILNVQNAVEYYQAIHACIIAADDGAAEKRTAKLSTYPIMEQFYDVWKNSDFFRTSIMFVA